MKRKLARPMAHTEIVTMTETLDNDVARNSAHYKKHRDGIITLNYSELEYIKIHMLQIAWKSTHIKLHLLLAR